MLNLKEDWRSIATSSLIAYAISMTFIYPWIKIYNPADQDLSKKDIKDNAKAITLRYADTLIFNGDTLFLKGKDTIQYQYETKGIDLK